MHEISQRLANELITGIGIAKQIPSVNCVATAGVEEEYGFAVERRGWRADGIESALVSGVGRDGHGTRRGKVRIASEIVLFENHMAERNGIPGQEAPSPVVA